MLGCVAGFYDYDWQEAERYFRLAMSRDPVPPSVRTNYALYYLLPIGRAADAAQQAERALQEDPLNLVSRTILAVCLAGAGRDEDSARECHKVLELSPAVPVVHALLSQHELAQGRLDQALVFAEKGYSLGPFVPIAIGALAGILKRAGDKVRSEELIQKLKPGDAFGVPRGLAIFHWVCGEMDATADWVDKAIEQRDPYILWGLRLFLGRDLRSSPRWPALMWKMNLPEN
jgi:tetratricopeptide (TPR) repeat protein